MGNRGMGEQTPLAGKSAEENRTGNEGSFGGENVVPEEFRTPEMRKFLEAFIIPKMGRSSGPLFEGESRGSSLYRAHAPEMEKAKKSEGDRSNGPGGLTEPSGPSGPSGPNGPRGMQERKRGEERSLYRKYPGGK